MPNPSKADIAAPSAHISVEGIIASAQKVEHRITKYLPEEATLRVVAEAVVEAARAAHRRITKMSSPVSLPNIRLYVLILAVVALAWWAYTEYLQPKVVKIAVVAGEYALLRDQADRNNVDNIEFVGSDGSSANVELLRFGRADMAVVQGGIQIPDAFTNLGVVRSEHVLFFVRDTLVQNGNPPAVVTFGEGQGSHILGKIFFRYWGYQDVEWIHSWGELATSDDSVIPDQIVLTD